MVRKAGARLVVVLVLTMVLGIIAHRRQALCREVPHGFARRAPIAGASGTNTFVCPEMYRGMPVADYVVAGVWAFALLALVRSVLVDREARRRWRLEDRDLYE